MPIRKAEAEWRGNLREGTGQVKVDSGLFEGKYGFASRFESGPGTNPEELLGAAHAACFSMALSGVLAKAGKTPTRIHSTAKVHIDKVGEGFTVTAIDLDTVGVVPGIDEAAFTQAAEQAKVGCPISRAINPSVK